MSSDALVLIALIVVFGPAIASLVLAGVVAIVLAMIWQYGILFSAVIKWTRRCTPDVKGDPR